MAIRLPVICLLGSLMVIAIAADLTPESYWNSALPNTPIIQENTLCRRRTRNLFLPSMTTNSGVMDSQAQVFRSEFLRVLHSRRSPEVPLIAETSNPVENPLFQSDTVPSTKAIESCPKEDIGDLKEMLKEENLHLYTEAAEQGRLPLLLLSLKKSSEQRRPAIVFMHGGSTNKEWLRPWLEAYASRGYVAIGLDSRYHGERADSKTADIDSLISCWRNGNTLPFLFDTVWDLIKLADYLTKRDDIDPKRIGITGISQGGMQAWFAAAADTRYYVAVPLIGVQAAEQGRLPLLILSLKKSSEQRRPAIVFMHGGNTNKEWLRPWLEAYASRGYVAIGLDSRYHGERAYDCKTAYNDALISSWRKGNTMPFIFDTVWDLIKLADYLTKRDDIDPKRIGITGISLGGMQAWFAAAADTRYSVAVPLIGVQGFRWGIENNVSLVFKTLFEEARIDLGKSVIDKEVVEKVWNRIAPGLASKFDSPYSLPVIAPRPLYILNGAKDPHSPLGGLEVPLKIAEKAYKETGYPENLKFKAEDGVGHEATSFMIKESSDWFDKFLKQEGRTCE